MCASTTLWEDLVRAAPPGDRPVAIGGVLTPDTLLAAYHHGVFPMPATAGDDVEINKLLYGEHVESGLVRPLESEGDPFALTWWSPDPRPVIPYGGLARSRDLARLLRNRLEWTTTADEAFADVLARCRAERRPVWLTEGLASCMLALHERGHAHSVEVWDGTELIGGTIGVGVGEVFSLDSCFHRRSNASKVALLDMQYRLAGTSVRVLDVEWDSDHNRRLGAAGLPRVEFVRLLGGGSHPAPAPGHEAVRRLGLAPAGRSTTKNQ